MDNQCLLFGWQKNICRDEISLSFWVRIRGGRNILRTGMFTISDSGPGILIEYNAVDQIMVVTFQSKNHKWSVNSTLFRYAWSHVAIAWDINTGLKVVVNARITGDESQIGADETGVKVKTENTDMR